jgi:hypothetical protein
LHKLVHEEARKTVKPTKHDDGPAHYTQTIYIKKGPTAEECKASKGPYGNEK